MAKKICGYDIIEELGESEYAKVYKVTDGKNIHLGKKYMRSNGQGIPTSALRELDILSRINHPNIIKLEKVDMRENCEACAVFEYADNNLERYIFNGLKDKDVLKIFYELACGVKELHANGIIHTDLKPENCIIKDGVVKIANLDSLITPSGDAYTPEYFKSIWWSAPEILRGDDNFTNKVDVWSLGLILANMYVKEPITGKADVSTVLDRIEMSVVKYKTKSHPPKIMEQIYNNVYKKIPENVLPLLFSMLEVNPSKRIGISDVLKHSVLDNFKCKITKDVFYSVDSTIAREFKDFGYADGYRDRTKLINLLNDCYKVFFKSQKNADVLFTAIDILDRAYPYHEVSYAKEKMYVMMYTYVATCFWIAAKIHTSVPFDAVDIIPLMNEKLYYKESEIFNKINKEDIFRAECAILKKLKFQVYHATLYSLFPKNKQKILNYLIENPSPINIKDCDGVNQRPRKIVC